MRLPFSTLKKSLLAEAVPPLVLGLSVLPHPLPSMVANALWTPLCIFMHINDRTLALLFCGWDLPYCAFHIRSVLGSADAVGEGQGEGRAGPRGEGEGGARGEGE